MNSKVRCAVIGAGWWGTYAHIPALLAHPHAELAAVQTRDAADAAKIARTFGLERCFTSIDEVFEAEVEAVVIASSPNLHYRQALEALRRGCHVLVEKPMTLAAAEARELVEQADRRGLQLLISAPWQYTRHARAARGLIRNGQLGELRMISVLMTNPVDHLIRGAATHPTWGQGFILTPHSETYSDPAVAGGGQLYAQVSHAAAYLAFLTGARPERVFARFHDDDARMDIYDAINIRFDNGCIATIASTGATPVQRRDYEVRVFGTRGLVFLDLWRGLLDFVPMHGQAEPHEPLDAAEIYPERAPANNLVDAVHGGENLSPGVLGLAAMEILDAAVRSARTGEDVQV